MRQKCNRNARYAEPCMQIGWMLFIHKLWWKGYSLQCPLAMLLTAYWAGFSTVFYRPLPNPLCVAGGESIWGYLFLRSHETWQFVQSREITDRPRTGGGGGEQLRKFRRKISKNIGRRILTKGKKCLCGSWGEGGDSFRLIDEDWWHIVHTTEY